MKVLNVEKEEDGTKSNEDSDVDDGEQLDQDLGQNTHVINDVVRGVCMDDPTDIKSDIQSLSSIVSDVVKDRLSTIHRTLPNTSTTQNHHSSNKHSPMLELSDGRHIRKKTAVWLFQEGERVSSDRLFRVRQKQPFSTETKTSTSEKSLPSEDTPYESDRVDVGEMCTFNEEEYIKIGRVLQFCHYEKKKVSEYQYQGRFAHTKQKDLGVLCTWFETGTYKMCTSLLHTS
jgi:hypothetical protein